MDPQDQYDKGLSMQPGSEEYSSLLNKMMAKLHHHNDDEEIDDLPLLEPAIGEAASQEAALDFKRTKKFVPTRYVPYCFVAGQHERRFRRLASQGTPRCAKPAADGDPRRVPCSPDR